MKLDFTKINKLAISTENDITITDIICPDTHTIYEVYIQNWDKFKVAFKPSVVFQYQTIPNFSDGYLDIFQYDVYGDRKPTFNITHRNSNVSIHAYIESKEITYKELENNFVKEEEKDIPMENIIVCPNCGNPSNLYSYPAASWSSAYKCNACSRLLLISHQDAISGVSHDVLTVFKEKS
jgi:hypothetical protein